MTEPTSPVVRVAQNLTVIVELYASLLAQAVHKATAKIDGHSLPGGEAMVALAGVADPKINARRVALHEERHMATCTRADHTRCWTGSEDEDDSEPVLQTLLFWSESMRDEHGFPLEGRRPTVATEANVIRSLLEWAWENLLEWDDFQGDIAKARTRLENLLMAGRRTERGVPCLSCSVDLIRPTWDRAEHACDGHDATCLWPLVPCPGHHGNEGVCEWPHPKCADDHDRGGLRDEWFCPSCERRYDLASYRLATEHAAFVVAEWLPLELAVSRTGAKRGSIYGWANRGHVRRKKDVETGHTHYNVPDIEARMNRDDDGEAA